MRILFLMKYWPTFGGGETVTRTLVNEFLARGHKVHVAYFFDKTENVKEQLSECLQVIKLPNGDDFLAKDNVSSLKKYISDNNINVLINQWNFDFVDLCNQIRDETFKMIFCHHMSVYTHNCIRNAKYYARCILGPVYSFLKKRKLRKIHRTCYNACDAYVMLSQSFQKEIVSLLELDERDNHVYAISNPKSTFPSLENVGKKKILLSVGRISESHKRNKLMCDVWKKIGSLDKYVEWQLVFVGDGPDLPELKRYAAQLNLKNVVFEGFRDPQKYYAESPIFLMTSSFEGFGMTLVEAQSHRCVPVVMDSFSSVHDIIKSNYNGILIKNNAINDYSAALMDLMDNPKKIERLANAGLKSSSVFDVSKIAQKWEELFDCLQKKKDNL